MNLKTSLTFGSQMLTLALLGMSQGLALAQTAGPATNDETRVAVVFTGGYETNPADHGRPVVLIAAALNVPSEVFRSAFSRVKPAAAGESPEPQQVRLNKQALLETLAPYGVTNERLDEVSNYYRYNRSRGEWWRYSRTTAYAVLHNGMVTGIAITNPGAGYTSPPKISIPGRSAVKATATLAFGTDFARNGSIKEIELEH